MGKCLRRTRARSLPRYTHTVARGRAVAFSKRTRLLELVDSAHLCSVSMADPRIGGDFILVERYEKNMKLE